MGDILFDKDFAEKNPDMELYWMQRGIKQENGIRYDITKMTGKKMGREYPKTKGHGHENKMAELYAVLQGEVIYLLQKVNEGKVVDVYAVKTKQGQSAVMPPDYEHITINNSGNEIEMANWVSEECQSGYGNIQDMGGACYFFTESGWVKNKRYKEIPELRFEEPLSEMPKDLAFLKEKH